MSGLASRLRERVTIEQPERTPDGYGGQEVSWSTLATVFAEVVPLTQNVRERSIADQVRAVAAYRVRIRARDDVDASMRLQWRGHVLHVHAVHAHGELTELLTYEEQA